MVIDNIFDIIGDIINITFTCLVLVLFYTFEGKIALDKSIKNIIQQLLLLTFYIF